MQIKRELLKREIGGESLLIPVGKTVYDANGLFLLTEAGAFIWDILPEVESEEEIVARVLEEYEIDEETARVDVRSFVSKLQDMEIL